MKRKRVEREETSAGGRRGQRWLADQLGISQPRVSELVNEGRISRKAAYDGADVKRAKAVLADGRAMNNATAGSGVDEDEAAADGDGDRYAANAIGAITKSPERIAKLKLIIERTAKIKLERELLAGGYIKKEDVERDRIGRVYAVRAKMQEIPLRASLIAHKGEADCERVLADWMKEICNSFAGT